MSEVTLEKIDIIRERTNASYEEAKEALEACDGNIVDALIYIEKSNKSIKEDLYTTKDEFINWLKDLIKKGNITRIRIKKDDKVVVDIPVNAGIAATLLSIVWPPLLGIGFLTAVFMKITVEITKDDGSVEVVNKIIKTTAMDLKGKVSDFASEVKDKFSSNKNEKAEENTYSYTVKFEDLDKDENN